MKVNDLLNVGVSELALGGKAVARHEGRVVFVDRGVPQDVVRVRLTRVKKSWAEARMESIERPSPLRVEARCPHVAICGGCRFQELDYAEQLRTKEHQVRETLIRLGGIEHPNVLPIRPAPATFHYRNKMEFSFAPDETGAPRLGMHERGAFDRVFALENCVLPSPLTVEIVRFTQRFAIAHGWQAYHPRLHRGVVRFLTVRHLPLTGQCAVHLVAADGDLPGLDAWANGVAALSSEIRTVTHGINRSRANVAFAEEERALVGEGVIEERLAGLSFEASSNTFLQTNSVQAEALYAAALGAARLDAGDVVLDLYCGAGTLTLLMARAAHEAIGVESVADAVRHARLNAKRNGITNARFVEGEARAMLRQWARGERSDAPRPTVVVVDPPRAGLHPRVVTRVSELAPRRVVYVSCNPATLARDLADFATHGYTLVSAEPFDMFPHTPHIECVACLEPAPAAGGRGPSGDRALAGS